ncbi:MAG: hypothetical protein LBC68_01495 [Prevotellaceae bacterium]|nr:hypothetical protein [Prevotellaceae bacterium]
MKKIFLTVACICTGLMLSSCGSDNDDNNPTSQDFVIDARNIENGNDYSLLIDSVTAVTNYEEEREEDTYFARYDVLATTNYVNGGFMMTLPANVNSVYLSVDETEWDGLSISDRNVKVVGIVPSEQIFAVKSGKLVGEFFYGKRIDDDNRIYVVYAYADRDVIINGSRTYQVGMTECTEYYNNVTFKKGWNEIYETRSNDDSANTSTEIYTNIKPNDELKWSFRAYYDGIIIAN